MNKKIGFFILFLTLCTVARSQEKPLTRGMVITQNTKIKKAVYKLDGDDIVDKPVILIEGVNITIDFNNATLKGSNKQTDPDKFFGTAIVISSHSNHVTIKNLKARGFKVAIMAKDVVSITLENCDLSYNYRQRLNSTQEKEDVSDWMSYHHNEQDEWLRYGAAIYLRGCNMAIIRNCKVTGGQNALMMTDCDDGLIVNNEFSFNSGIGIGMYRCNYNQVAYNKIDFNVRGYSDGVYNRGQDSAGILVYEQSGHNLFYKNSVTHSGDGFFLWAGQTTMDDGSGGCNDNILFGNDFSYAPTNGVEVTFSRNKILKNRIFECDNGIWGGYSFNTVIANNQFRNNRVGIAIEHGQDNDIHHNLFLKDKTAIKLWGKKEEPSDWGYPKYRDTKSRGYRLALNSYNDNAVAMDITRTDSIRFSSDIASNVDVFFKSDSTVTGIDSSTSEELINEFSIDSAITGPAIENPVDPFKGMGKLAGRKNILITEWGPYDFRYPIIWNTNPMDTSGVMQFDLKGPAGKWKIKSIKGVDSVSAKSGVFPATITAKKIKAERTDITIDLDYVGEPVTTQQGEMVPKGKAFTFSFKKFFQPVQWNVNWFKMDTAFYNPIKTGQLFSPNVRMAPIKTETTDRLDYAWWGGLAGATQFITVADGSARMLAGEYELSVTWDDAVRVIVDGKLVIDEWDPLAYNFDQSPNKKIILKMDEGVHQFNVEHLELGGFATLSLKIIKIK